AQPADLARRAHPGAGISRAAKVGEHDDWKLEALGLQRFPHNRRGCSILVRREHRRLRDQARCRRK
ncbi:MAG: hypothetical protein ACE1ZD_06135, partial [Dehalococcoidia bacterium]